jgi:hypothetical protein
LGGLSLSKHPQFPSELRHYYAINPVLSRILDILIEIAGFKHSGWLWIREKTDSPLPLDR